MEPFCFFNFVRAIIGNSSDAPKVLDFGAGRGSFHYSKTSSYSAGLHDFQKIGEDVWAADIDEIVNTHPCSDHQTVLKIGEPLPFDDGTFDVIVGDFVFEHIEDPKGIARELLRITKPNGWICARTPNKWGYVTLDSRLIPNKLHSIL
jgi:2-polyprenyl-3-methyl-5-hydroxy-6-metoxy-1,4-benzoquinol methylase